MNTAVATVEPIHRPLATQQENPYLSLVQSIVNAGGDMANLRSMLDLQIEWEKNEARKAYVASMAAFKAEPMEILKRKLVEFTTRDGETTSYMHAELSDVTDAVVPAMGKHGLSHRWDIKQEGGQITVSCTITHALGHSEAVSMTAAPDGSGKKNPIQQVASTVSYLERYTLLAATGMATKGMDDDGRTWAEGAAEIDPNQAWIDKIRGAIDRVELQAIKSELRSTFDNKTPASITREYNARLEQIA